MEFFIYFCSSLLICFLVVKVVKTKGNSILSKHKLPPGPKKLAFIGNIHQLSGSLPHHTLRNLSNKHGPLMHLQLGEIPVVVVSSPEMAKEVFRTHDIILSNRPITQATSILSYNHLDITFAPYGHLWRMLRKICTLELLTAKRVLSFRSIREDEVFNTIRSIMSKKEAGQVVNLSRIIFSMNYIIIARAAFGKKSMYHDDFINAVEGIMHILGGFHIVDMFPSFKILKWISGTGKKVDKFHSQVDKIVGAIVDDHKLKFEANHEQLLQETNDDLVDVLLNIQRHDQSDFPLTDTVIKAVIFDMFAAGGETTSTTTVWAISELIRNPKIMERAQHEVRQVYHEKGNVDESMLNELKFLKAVVKETLRLHPPLVMIVPRVSSEKCEISGYEIPAKTTILINAWAMGRDSKYWTNADKYEPDRFLDSKIEYNGNHFEYVPFGGGRRICPGISFAIPNIQLSLAQLLFHFDWKLPGEIMPEEMDMAEKFGLTVGRKNDLHLIPTIYPYSCLETKA